MTTETEKSPREIAGNIARLSLPCSAFRNESEWKDTITFLTNTVEKALRDRDERAAKIADAVQNEWLENARNVARADDLVGGLVQSTYTSYAEVARKIASAIRAKSK